MIERPKRLAAYLDIGTLETGTRLLQAAPDEEFFTCQRNEHGRQIAHGRAIAKLPLPPRLAHMLVAAGEMGFGALACEVAVLLSERGLGGNDVDLDVRLERWRREKGERAEAARGLAKKWGTLLPSPSGEGSGVELSTRAIPAPYPPPPHCASHSQSIGQNIVKHNLTNKPIVTYSLTRGNRQYHP